MRIKVKNLGSIKQAEFELGDFTIICGTNNTGKTYATYALFGFLTNWKDSLNITIKNGVINNLFNQGIAKIDLSHYLNRYKEILEKGCEEYTKSLPIIFSAPKEHFSQTKFQIILEKSPDISDGLESRFQFGESELIALSKKPNDNNLTVSFLVENQENAVPAHMIRDLIKKVIIDILFSEIFPNPFISSAERTGAAIFSSELNFSRNRLLKEMHRLDKDIDPIELLLKNYQDYALPVEKNVDFIRNLKRITKQKSFIAENHADLLQDFADIIGGNYSITANDELHFKPKGAKIKLTIDESSSAVRSLLDIGFYLRHVAQVGDLLIIDEPELNLHPENQRCIARLFSRLIKIGMKIFITTHSDFLVKELNTLIILNHDDPYLREIARTEGYSESEFISSQKVKVYIAEKASIKLEENKRKYPYQTLTAAKIDAETGIEARSFDQTISTMNRIQEAIIWR